MALVSMAIYGIAHGFAIASISVTTMKLFGVEHLSNSMGHLMTCCGVGTVIIGPVSGMP